jgi:hypothetical protein
MPERLDRVSVGTQHGTVAISWEARDALLAEFRAAVSAFEAVGASRPVMLDWAEKRIVLEAIHAMAEKTPGGFDDLDPGLVQLRHKLAEELGFSD